MEHPTTRESLDLLIDRVPTLRVLAFITFRPEFAPPWIGRPHVTMLTLNRLPFRQRPELIFRPGTPPDAEYTFKHALVQDAVYGTLLRGRRQQLHARIAATLEDQFPEIVVAQPALLSQHCAEGGLAEKAVEG